MQLILLNPLKIHTFLKQIRHLRSSITLYNFLKLLNFLLFYSQQQLNFLYFVRKGHIFTLPLDFLVLKEATFLFCKGEVFVTRLKLGLETTEFYLKLRLVFA